MSLKALCQNFSLSVFYYFEYEGGGTTDLMLFFTCGRQGLGLQPKQQLDVTAFESGVEGLMAQWQAVAGHHSDGLYRPDRRRVVELITDEELVLHPEP